MSMGLAEQRGPFLPVRLLQCRDLIFSYKKLMNPKKSLLSLSSTNFTFTFDYSSWYAGRRYAFASHHIQK